MTKKKRNRKVKKRNNPRIKRIVTKKVVVAIEEPGEETPVVDKRRIALRERLRKNFKTKLGSYLAEKDITQAEAISKYRDHTGGEPLGKDRMSKYVNGKVEPQVGFALNLAAALDCNVEDIFDNF